MRLLLFCWLPLASCTLAQAEPSSLHTARVEAAKTAYDGRVAAHASGRVQVVEVCEWSVRWYEAQRDAGDASAGSAHLARMEALAAQTEEAWSTGAVSGLERETVRYFVAEAKVWASEGSAGQRR